MISIFTDPTGMASIVPRGKGRLLPSSSRERTKEIFIDKGDTTLNAYAAMFGKLRAVP
jgi:hypothetical protein